jgi:hypothetical protein
LLNGKTARVSMSVIPPERGGMASGISGTLRFIGLVTGASGTQTRGTGLHSADKNDCQKRSKRGNAAGDDQHGGAGWRGVSPARRGLIGADRWRPAMFKMSKCFARLFHSPRSRRGAGAGDGIASDDHPVHSSTNDI